MRERGTLHKILREVGSQGGTCTCNEQAKNNRHTQRSLKALVLISIWCHELCSFQWQRKSKGFREKRPEDCLISQPLKRDFHSGRSHPGVPDGAQRSFLRSNLYPDLRFWSQETSPLSTPLAWAASTGTVCLLSLKHLLHQSITRSSPFHLEILLKSLHVLAECRDQENSSGAPPGIPGSSMTYFSPHLRCAPGSLLRTDTRLDGPPAASRRRRRGAPGTQQRGPRGDPRCRHWMHSPSTGVPLCPPL